MLADRWVVTDPGEAVPGYYFRDHDPNFGFIALEVTDRADGRRLGFIVMRTDAIHGPRTITVLDHHFVNPADERCLLPLAVEQARAFRADRIVLPTRLPRAGGGIAPVRPILPGCRTSLSPATWLAPMRCSTVTSIASRWT